MKNLDAWPPTSPATALRLCGGNALSPRHRQGRRRVGDLRAGLHADHDRSPARRGPTSRSRCSPVKSPINAKWYNQYIEQAPFALAAGCALHLRAQSVTHVSVRPRGVLHWARSTNVIREFGAIGNGIPLAIGVAAARKDGRTVLFDGDGGFLMRARAGNDPARQAESAVCHPQRRRLWLEDSQVARRRRDDSGAIFGRTDLAAIEGFGQRGTTVTDVVQFPTLFDAYQAQGTAEVWNVHISDQVMNPSSRRQLDRGHGKDVIAIRLPLHAGFIELVLGRRYTGRAGPRWGVAKW